MLTALRPKPVVYFDLDEPLIIGKKKLTINSELLIRDAECI